jgi:hypothetical protein
MGMVGFVAVTVFAIGGVVGVPAAVSSPDYAPTPPAYQATQPHQFLDVHLLAQASPAAPAPTTTTTAPPIPTPAVVAATPVSTAAAVAPAPPALPAPAQATAWGCSAALAYLQAYAAPGFALDCPGYAEGHEAMTCIHGTPAYPDACLNGPEIAIADACPQAYMNEAANSWNLSGQLSTEQQKLGVSYAEIDPFGACP